MIHTNENIILLNDSKTRSGELRQNDKQQQKAKDSQQPKAKITLQNILDDAAVPSLIDKFDKEGILI